MKSKKVDLDKGMIFLTGSTPYILVGDINTGKIIKMIDCSHQFSKPGGYNSSRNSRCKFLGPKYVIVQSCEGILMFDLETEEFQNIPYRDALTTYGFNVMKCGHKHFAAVGSTTNAVEVFDLQKKKEVYYNKSFGGEVRGFIKGSTNEPSVFVATGSDYIQLHDLEKKKMIQKSKNFGGYICGLDESPTTKLYCGGRYSRRIVSYFDPKTLEIVGSTNIEKSGSTIWELCCLGNYVWVTRDRGRISILDVRKYDNELFTFKNNDLGSNGNEIKVVNSQNGLIAGSIGSSVILWEAEKMMKDLNKLKNKPKYKKDKFHNFDTSDSNYSGIKWLRGCHERPEGFAHHGNYRCTSIWGIDSNKKGLKKMNLVLAKKDEDERIEYVWENYMEEKKYTFSVKILGTGNEIKSFLVLLYL